MKSHRSNLNRLTVLSLVLLCSCFAEFGSVSFFETITLRAQQQSDRGTSLFGAAAEDHESRKSLQRAVDLNHQALALNEQGRFEQALPLAEEALRIREQVLGPTHLDVAASLNTLGLILHQLLRLELAERHMNRALTIRERARGPIDPDVAENLTNKARIMYAGGNFVEAQRVLEKARDTYEKTLGVSHPDYAVSLTHLGIVQSQMGDLSGALKNLEGALRILESSKDDRRADLATALSRLGNVRGRIGDFAGGRASLERSLELREQVFGAKHPHVARSLSQLAYILEKLGDTREALALIKNAFEINQESLGQSHPEIAGNLNDLARLSLQLNDVNAAIGFLERALQLQEQTVGSKHPFVAVTLSALAEAKLKKRETAQARELLERALQIQKESVGVEHIFVATTLASLGYLEAGAGNFTKAQPLFERALEIRERILGPNHSDVALSLNEVARTLHVQGKLVEARPLYESARRIYLKVGILNENLDDAALSDVWNRGLNGLRNYAELLASLGRTPNPDRSAKSAIEDAFRVAEQSRLGIAHVAIARAAARASAGNPLTASLARNVQEFRNRRQAVSHQLTIEYGKTLAERDVNLINKLRNVAHELEQDLSLGTARLQASNPAYAELASPEPIDVAAVKGLLHEGEALISFWVLHDRLMIWLIKPGQELIYRDFHIDRPNLVKVVTRVRQSLDQSDNLSLANVRPSAFDVAGAYQLYTALFGSLRAELAGVRHLMIVPDEILLPLPFGSLIHNNLSDSFKRAVALFNKKAQLEKADLAHYRNLSWLIKEYATTVLPSASSLRALRYASKSRTSGPVEPFIGFGDPVLEGNNGARGGPMLATRGSTFSVRDVRRLDRLPGSAAELTAIAKTLGADPEKVVYLAERAREPILKNLNDTRVLAKSRIIAFATHGLLAGQLTDLKQPALVLTPPDQPGEGDNGLLELDEILALKLDRTEWAVLSACNTGATAGSRDGLAGLARAFFFAGAQSLLVSHWNVDDSATQALMSKVFHLYSSKDENLSRAEALRRGMLAVMSDTNTNKAYFAHPFAWAPFFLVGDGSGSSN